MRQICIQIAIVFFVLTATAFGQRITGSINGRITDATGAVLPGVDVTVTNDATGQVRTNLTNEAGLYNVPLLISGTYTVEASLPGFRTEIRRGVLVEVDRTARVQIQLQVGVVTETVEVTADAPLVESESSSLGQVIDSKRVAELPLNGRHFLSLAALTPGVQPHSEGSNFAEQSGSVSVNGAREAFNNFMYDGVDNNDPGPAQLIIIPNIDSIQEFKVQTSNFSAEYGKAAGGLINVTTKSGANAFHGSVFEFLRNSAMDARNFFDDPDKPKPSFKRNQFGGSVGGPIARNKTFFFVSYEGTIIRQPQIRTARVPPAAWRSGDFSSLGKDIIDPLTRSEANPAGVPFPGNVIPQDRIHPTGQAFLDLYPLPNLSGVNNLRSVSNFTTDQDSVVGRVDHQFSDKDSVFVRYALWNQPRLEPYKRNNNVIAGGGVFLLTRTQSLVINHTHIFTPNVVNELRVGYARLKGALYAEQRDREAQIRALALPGTRIDLEPNLRKEFLTQPQVRISGFSTGGGYRGPQIRFDNSFDYMDNLSWTKGAHQMKIGIEARRAQNSFHSGSWSAGGYRFFNRYTGNAVADLLLGFPSRTNRTLGYKSGYARTWHISAYIQDDWRVNDKLTLNLGLRYEKQSNGHMIHDNKVNFDEQLGITKLVGDGPIQADIVPVLEKYPGLAIKDGTIPRSGWHDDWNDWGPRVGFAYDFAGDGKAVIRGGGGIFYLTQMGGSGEGHFSNSYHFPFRRNNNVFASTDPSNPNVSLSNPFPEEFLGTSFTGSTIPLNKWTPYMIQYNLTTARQLDQTTVLELAYAGSKGNHLHRYRDVNAARPGPGSIASRRPYPNYSSVTSFEDSTSSVYHSLQLRLDRRLARGLSVLGAYTWSKSIDGWSGTGQRASGGSPQDPYDLKHQRGPSIFDRTQRLSAAFLWELPIGRNATGIAAGFIKGWQINSIYTFSSGQPYTPELQGDNSLTGGGPDRPNLIGQWKLDKPDPAGWVNKAAFAIPPRGQYGNAGRNVLRGPGLNNLDLALAKRFPYKDIANFLEFRAEVFNLPNHPQFFLPNRFANSGSFGIISGARDSRQVQISLRLSF